MQGKIYCNDQVAVAIVSSNRNACVVKVVRTETGENISGTEVLPFLSYCEHESSPKVIGYICNEENLNDLVELLSDTDDDDESVYFREG